MENFKGLIDGVFLELEELKKTNVEIWKDLLPICKTQSLNPKFKKGDKVYLANDVETEFFIEKVFCTSYSYKYKIHTSDDNYNVIADEKYLTLV